MDKSLQVLILEDRQADAELIIHELRQGGFDPHWQQVDTEAGFHNALKPGLDLILADYSLPQFDALRALHDLQKSGLEIPFIIITGSVSEEIAVECMKQGASDYLIKDRLARLCPAVNHALRQKKLAADKLSTELALKESEALNRAVLNSLNAHIAVLDTHGNVIAANEAWNLFAAEDSQRTDHPLQGVQCRPAVGQNYLEICKAAADAGLDDSLQALNGIQSILDCREALFSMEYQHQAEGDNRWFTLYTTPLEEGRIGAVVSHLEITGLKQAEERLRLQSTALEAAPTAMIITDRQGEIVWVNPAFTRLTGYSPVEAIGHNSRLVSSGIHEPAYFQEMWNTILGGEIWKREIRNRRKDGSLYTSEITIAPVRNENGEITHFIDIEEDVTERKQHERELEAIVVVANAMRTAKSRVEMLPVIIEQLLDLFKAQGGSISLFDPANEEMVVALARGPFARAAGVRVSVNEGLTGLVISSRQPYISRGVSVDPRFNDVLFDRVYSIVGMPLIAQGQLIGVIWLGRIAEFTQNELRVLTAIGDMAANAIYRASLNEETELRLKRLTALREIDQVIIEDPSLNRTLMAVIEKVIPQLSVDAADILLYTPDTRSLEFFVGYGFRNIYSRSSRLLASHYALRTVMDRKVVTLYNLDNEDPVFQERMRDRGEQFRAYCAVPLENKGQVKGVLEIFNRTPIVSDPEWENFRDMLAGQAVIAIDIAELISSLQRKNDQLEKAYEETIEGWARAMELRDKVTEGHIRRVTDMTVDLARAVGLPETEIVHIRRGALLHDIGKMMFRDEVLFKKEPLTQEDWDEIKQHPLVARELLSRIEYLHPALDIPYCHHEHWDGSGYPQGLAGEQIPIAARIFSIIDVYEALQAGDRPYRLEGWDPERIRDYIREQSGKMFDPQVVDVFLKMKWD
ncbi:MAG TPA: HD domain-containing phosphohydrolase [Anaerolineaceae bacterium]|nr:HD domain-containing phosphohydrolase [Anaerolineaceae bacterium]